MQNNIFENKFYFEQENLNIISQHIKRFCPQSERNTLHIASDIINGNISIFGEKYKYKKNIDWLNDPITKRKWRIFRDRPFVLSRKNKDIKYVWELNRHQHFIALGKSYIFTGEKKYAIEIKNEILNWIKNNPYKKGINWDSPLEIAIRIISWSWALNMINSSGILAEKSYMKIADSIHEQAKYIANNYQKRECPNNHLIGEISALVIIGILFPYFKESQKWKVDGLEILKDQIEKQVYPDGVDKEMAIDYHRFVLDFYTHVVVLCMKNNIEVSDQIMNRLEKMYEVLLYTVRPDRTGPMIGDDDNARVVRLSEESGRQFNTALSTGAVLFNRGDMKYIAENYHEESFWLLGMEGYKSFCKIREYKPEKLSYRFIDSGLYVMRTGWDKNDHYLLFDCGPQGMGQAGHGHADSLSFELAAYGRTLISDSGTFTYNGQSQWRNYFRGTSAHNTVVIDGQDQAQHLKPYEQFGWRHKADGNRITWKSSKNYDFISGYHEGYHRLKEPAVHQRSVFFIKNEYWVITDFIYGAGRHKCDLLFHLSPCDILFDKENKSLKTCNNDGGNILIIPADERHVQADVVKGSIKPISGWVSFNYGSKEETHVLRYSKTGGLPVIFNTLIYPYKKQGNLDISIDKLEINSESNSHLSHAQCMQIINGKIKDFYLISNRKGVIKEFQNYKTDARLIYFRKNANNEISKIVLKDGSFLSEGNKMLLKLDKELQDYEWQANKI